MNHSVTEAEQLLTQLFWQVANKIPGFRDGSPGPLLSPKFVPQGHSGDVLFPSQVHASRHRSLGDTGEFFNLNGHHIF